MDDISGKGFVTLGRPGRGVRELAAPFGLAIDAQGGSRTSREWDTARTGKAGSGVGQLDQPLDVAIPRGAP